jgi:dihydrofolate synthase/folylpolyglutamate synthase
VSFDHMHILGDTIEKIAAEKAGIIKSGVPVVTAVEDEAAFQVIQEKAASLRTKVYRLGKDFHISGEHMDEEQQYFTFHGPFVQYKDVRIGLRGYHQFKNAATSLMTLEILRQYFAFNVDEEGIYTGLREAINPGRLEVISEGPFIVLDGAHNAHGAKAISSSVPHLFNYDQLILVVSIMQDKLMDEMLDHLLPLTNQIVITRARNPRAVDPAILSEKVRNKQPELPIYIEQEPIDAVKRAVALASPKDLVLVTGSLYLIESIRDNLSHVIEKKVGEKW